MNTLAHFTNSALMVPELQSRAAGDVLAELCFLLYRHGRITNSAAFLDAVVKRELISPTAIAPGWALAHARLRGITQLSFALGCSSEPLVWFGGSSIRPQRVFLFAVPEAEAGMYLRVIAAVAKLSQNAALLALLQSARDGDSMFRILQQIPLRQARQPAMAAARMA